MIKPNVPSWRWITLSNAFTVSLKMNDSGNRYGFTSNIDTHVMKNTEWAVVAYLSQSKYGKLGNINFKGTNKEVYQNKSNEKITGCSYGKPPNNDTDYGCHYQYNEEINGTGASTTGTTYGIYDMSGGAWEYVMATYNNLVGDSGFDVPPASQYYNKYTDTNLSTACNKEECISHALSETNYWYKDSHGMVTEEKPWLVRGGAAGSPDAGIFYFYAPINKGWASDAGSFRITIALNP